MKVETYRQCDQIYLYPGEYHSICKPGVLSTLLGSCIAACLYDPKSRMIGMNHFLLSSPRYPVESAPTYQSEASRYGVHAMELLINDMMSKGANRHLLRAKIFGGATILDKQDGNSTFFSVGHANCEFIQEFLKNEDIPIDAEDLGGTCGRVIHFSNGDYSVYCRKIKKGSDNRQLAKRDQNCWQGAIKNQLQGLPSVELW